MRIIDAPQAVLRMQYRIVRFPLQIIEDVWSLAWGRKRQRDCSATAHWD
jgi:hypothetical protein